MSRKLLIRVSSSALALALSWGFAATTPAEAAPPAPGDPAYSVDEADLAAALECSEFTHPDREPVLLVHGTGTSGHEQFDWNYRPFLLGAGFDVCIVTYPDRGTIDLQVSAEYVAWAIEEMSARAGGGLVDLMGHSQGALMPRWAIRWWPGAQAAVDDAVLLAGPQHGSDVADHPFLLIPGSEQSESFFQMATGSEFVTTLNAGDETPGAIDYTSIWTDTDELVQPPSTAALAEGVPGGEVFNASILDLCPGRTVDHLSIGTTDRAVRDLVVDAFVNDGAADPARLPELCPTPVADQFGSGSPQSFQETMQDSFANGFAELHLASEEPPIRGYAQGPSASVPDLPAPALALAATGLVGLAWVRFRRSSEVQSAPR